MVIDIYTSRMEVTFLLGLTKVGRFLRLFRIGLLGKLATISIVALGGAIVDRPAVAQLTLATCATDDEIPPDKRATIEQAGLRFVQALVSLDTEAAYSELSSGAKQSVPRDKVAALIAQTIQPMAPFSAVRVAQIHLVKVATNASTARILCGSSLARPEDWVSVAVRPVAEQAHLLIDAQTRNNVSGVLRSPSRSWRDLRVCGLVQPLGLEWTQCIMLSRSRRAAWKFSPARAVGVRLVMRTRRGSSRRS